MLAEQTAKLNARVSAFVVEQERVKDAPQQRFAAGQHAADPTDLAQRRELIHAIGQRIQRVDSNNAPIVAQQGDLKDRTDSTDLVASTNSDVASMREASLLDIQAQIKELHARLQTSKLSALLWATSWTARALCALQAWTG